MKSGLIPKNSITLTKKKFQNKKYKINANGDNISDICNNNDENVVK